MRESLQIITVCSRCQGKCVKCMDWAMEPSSIRPEDDDCPLCNGIRTLEYDSLIRGNLLLVDAEEEL